ncbi:RNA 2',3'-cyclic phosphodiesterase [Oceanidesulfovibrio marinus]|uniref:RNA 2',3'-cyclic phosphodiesterase n=1 Tax=Oceanidesulfovibrio marinus TaxID=370038 RepID=A0A6P1ZH95_9BACT|nr:RNA 2',3'-cyclic phosphodiesterase [Oceanidesulfovibrio marinus]TVM32499.1 RNA 2',3'-cyclic phosphodiesterase [Oceanidesulfovibrio marinus]
MRCFVGLPLPESYQDGLERVRRQWGPRFAPPLTWTRPGNWHITLAFLGEVEESQQPDLEQALSAVAFAPFTLQAGGAGVFPPQGRPKVLWVGALYGGQAVAALAGDVQQALIPLGFVPDDRPFTTHLTLARTKRGKSKRRKHTGAKRGAGDESFQKIPDANAWQECIAGLGRVEWPPVTMDSFILWRSHLSEAGPRYEPLVSFGATSESSNG